MAASAAAVLIPKSAAADHYHLQSELLVAVLGSQASALRSSPPLQSSPLVSSLVRPSSRRNLPLLPLPFLHHHLHLHLQLSFPHRSLLLISYLHLPPPPFPLQPPQMKVPIITVAAYPARDFPTTYPEIQDHNNNNSEITAPDPHPFPQLHLLALNLTSPGCSPSTWPRSALTMTTTESTATKYQLPPPQVNQSFS